MPKMRLLHNPRCSKSRQALQLLQSQAVDVEIVEYLKTPLDLNALTQLYQALKLNSVLDMMRVKEPEFVQAGVSKTSDNTALLEAIARYPKLLERPILIAENDAVIGRPPENIQRLLSA